MKQSRNQHTMYSGITEREAEQIRGCIRKLRKIKRKPKLDSDFVKILQQVNSNLTSLLIFAEREL